MAHVSSVFLLALSVADAGYFLMRMFKNLESASGEELYSHRLSHLHVLCHSIFNIKIIMLALKLVFSSKQLHKSLNIILLHTMACHIHSFFPA